MSGKNCRAGFRKAQVNLLDTVLAIFLFMMMVVFIVGFWSQNVSASKNTVKKNRMEYFAASATDMMVKSPGAPSNWEHTGQAPSSLGLAISQNVLSSSKLSNFTAMNYSAARALIGTSNEFYFSVESAEGNVLYQSGNASISSPLQVAVSRLAMLGGQPVTLRLILHG